MTPAPRDVWRVTTPGERLATLATVLALTVEVVAVLRGRFVPAAIGGAVSGFLGAWVVASLLRKRGEGL
jgi:hypothetical protein